MVSRSARFSPARWCARYGPAQGGSRGRWASASSVRRPGFKPRTHDWASNVVPGTPRIRQNPPGWYVRGRQIRLSVPLLPLLPFTLFLSFFFSLVAKARQGGLIFVSAVSRTCLDERLLVLTFSSPGHRACTPRDVTTARVDILWNRDVFDPVDDRNVGNFSRSIVSTLLDYTEWSIASCRRVDKYYRIFFQIFFQASNGLGLIKQRKIFWFIGIDFRLHLSPVLNYIFITLVSNILLDLKIRRCNYATNIQGLRPLV